MELGPTYRKKGKKILVVSAYRVSQTYPGEAGHSTAFMQQYRAMLKANISKPKPKHSCLLELATFLKTWKQQFESYSIILMMDANGDASDKQLRTFISDTTLHDVVAHLSPALKSQSTYINGQKRLDYILVSEDLILEGMQAGHTDFLHPFVSDHRGVYWDVPSTAIFDSSNNLHQHVTHRGLQLDRPHTVEAYIRHLTHLYDKHRILQRSSALETEIGKTTSPEKLQKLQSQFSALDIERTRYMKSAEHRCKRRKNTTYEWSPALARMGGRVTYWKKRQTDDKE